MQLEIKRLALVLGGIALSLVFLLISLRQVDVASIKMAFFSLQYFPLIGCAAFLAAGVLIRSVRWRMLAGQSRQNQLHFYRATTLGVFANLIFPIRAGEIVRVYTLAKLTGSSYTVPLASALLDRLTDLFVLLLSAVIVYWFSPMTELLGSWMSFLFIGTSATLLIVIVYVKSAGFGESLLTTLFNRLLRSWPVSPNLFITEFREELHHLVNSWLSVRFLLIVLLIMTLDYAAFTLLLYAFQLHISPEAPLFLWVFLAAGSALPSAPGYLGVYQVAAVWALSLFAVPAPTAVAIATTLQLIMLVVSLLMTGTGAWNMCRRAVNSSILIN